ncbi:MAG TPA: hypothetical protein PK569_19895 [Thermoanaerobaculia bacterium]|nr:hypothetical protein [Thermoanaerobaculia bacterium]
MDDTRAETPAERLRIAFELFALAEEMVRQSFRRRNPEASDAEPEEAVEAWLARRPGAEHGACPGRPVPWPRPR